MDMLINLIVVMVSQVYPYFKHCRIIHFLKVCFYVNGVNTLMVKPRSIYITASCSSETSAEVMRHRTVKLLLKGVLEVKSVDGY